MLAHKKVFRKTMIILLSAFALPIVIGLLYITIQGQVVATAEAAEITSHNLQQTETGLHTELQTQQTQHIAQQTRHITKQTKDKTANFLSTTSDINVTYDKNDVYDINDEHDIADTMTADKLIAAYEDPEPLPINWDNARKHFMAGCFIITIVFSLTSIIISTCTLIRRKYYEHKEKKARHIKRTGGRHYE